MAGACIDSIIMKKYTLTIVFISLIAIGFWAGFRVLHANPPIVQHLTYQSTPVPTPQYAIPKILDVPKLGIHASVESVGMDATGNMDVPKDANNVAWYNLGYYPGEIGSAVIAGHLDTATGSAVFAKLSTLKPGDTITVIDERNNTKAFAVTAATSFPYDKFPIAQVFGATSSASLNLITCGGTYDRKVRTYLRRTVVFTKAI